MHLSYRFGSPLFAVAIAAFLWLSFIDIAHADTLWGVNLSGGSFGNGGLNLGTEYTYGNNGEIDYFASKGVKIIRLDFLAKRLVRNGAISEQDATLLGGLIDHAAAKGMRAVLDMHDYGRTAAGKLIGRDAGSVAEFANEWQIIATRFKDKPNVVWGLMNEPNEQSATEWLAGANAAIKAIRDLGANQTILVPGSYWDGAWTWISSDNDTVMGNGVVDPANNYVFEVHQYLDTDSSGTHTNVVSATVGTERLTAVTNWAKANGKKFFIGEIGIATDQTSLTALDNMFAYIQQNPNVWWGVTYWAAGPWWGEYMYTIEPKNGVDRAQMGILKKYSEATGTNVPIDAPPPPSNTTSTTTSQTPATSTPPAPAVDITAPSIVRQIIGISTSPTQAQLTWQASTDVVGVAGYKIYRNGIQIATTAGTSYSDSNLYAGTAYVYAISAYDAAGNVSEQSTGVSITTTTPPPVPTPPPVIPSQPTTPPPPVVPTPTPPTSSGIFSAGERIATTDNVNVRTYAGIGFPRQEVRARNSAGTVTAGPQIGNGYTWWKVRFDTGTEGWVVQNFLGNAVASSNSTADLLQRIAEIRKQIEVLTARIAAMIAAQGH